MIYGALNNKTVLFTNTRTNKFLNLILDSVRLHKRIYVDHRITIQQLFITPSLRKLRKKATAIEIFLL